MLQFLIKLPEISFCSLILELFYNVDVTCKVWVLSRFTEIACKYILITDFLKLLINNNTKMIIIVSEPDLPLDCFHFSFGTLRMGVNLNCMYYSGHVF